MGINDRRALSASRERHRSEGQWESEEEADETADRQGASRRARRGGCKREGPIVVM
jgi:hypothetical protein